MRLKPDLLVEIIFEAYKKKIGVFKKRINAEDLLPRDTSKKEKALFLFYVIQLDYSIKSQTLYAGAERLWDDDSSFFFPDYISKAEKNTLRSTLEEYLKPRYMNEAVKRWKINSKKLLNEYEGNPLKIFDNKLSAKTVLEHIREFRGFGPKIGNFFLRAIVNTFDLRLENIEDISQPVDVHDIRLTYEWGFIPDSKVSQKNIRLTQEIWQKACKKAKISWLVFDKALWLLGSEGKRSGNPINDLKENLGLTEQRIEILQRR
ncbi:MAG: hypothetical protein ABIE03_04810 [Patescibacteria group bacterium]|nr:hypothetical protein [Patescibacteria group bacterium]